MGISRRRPGGKNAAIIPKIDYRPDIDGLRALAVGAVISFHADPDLLSGGYLGVDVFFVISGYLITRLVLAGGAARRFSFAAFYERRIRRIAPALVPVLAATSVAAWLLLPTIPMIDYANSLIAAVLFGANIWFWRTSGYFDPDAGGRSLLHLWSLSVEEQFYLLYPAALLWCARRHPRGAAAFIVAGLLVSFLAALTIWPGHPQAVFFLLPTRGWELLAGAAVTILPAGYSGRLPAPVRGIACLAALAAMLASFVLAPTSASPLVQAVPVFATAFLIAAGEQGPTRMLLSWRPLVGLGLISYSAYLWHQPLFVFARYYTVGPLDSLAQAGLVILTLILASASWYLVERPSRRPGFGSRRVVLALALGAVALFAALGLILSRTSVNAWRVGPRVMAAEAATATFARQRQEAIRSGTCNFNGSVGPYSTSDEFLRHWDCWGSPTLGRVIVGDSHAADLAVAFRSLGMDVGQFTSAGCSLVPDQMIGECRRHFDFFRAAARAHGVRTLVLANSFQPEELDTAAFDAMARYWSLPGTDIWFFTGLPIYPDFRVLRPRTAATGGDLATLRVDPDFAIALRSEALAYALAARNPRFHVFNSRTIFCAITRPTPCGWSLAGTPLLLDGHHFTVEGARAFGRSLAGESLMR